MNNILTFGLEEISKFYLQLLFPHTAFAITKTILTLKNLILIDLDANRLFSGRIKHSVSNEKDAAVAVSNSIRTAAERQLDATNRKFDYPLSFDSGKSEKIANRLALVPNKIPTGLFQ